MDNSPDLPGPAVDGLPRHVADAALQAADILYRAMSPAKIADPGNPALSTLWSAAKLLNSIAGGIACDLDLGDTAECDRNRAQWDEAAYNASAITTTALKAIAAGMTPKQASDWTMNQDSYSVGSEPFAAGGTIKLVPPDIPAETDRTLTITITSDPAGPLTVTSDRGPAPEPRPQTAATAVRTWHHLNQLAEILHGLVVEPAADGVPVCQEGKEYTCQVCERVVDGAVARVVETGDFYGTMAEVCSVACARAAYAGDHLG